MSKSNRFDNKDAYELGVRAYFEGKSIKRNPYPKNSPQFSEWNDGWRMAESQRPTYDEGDTNDRTRNP